LKFYFHPSIEVCCLYSIDATEEPAPGTSSLGRLINHSRKGNVSPKVVEVDGVPRVCFFAKWQLNIGDQVLYDYGVKLPFADLVCLCFTLVDYNVMGD
jgi:SET domain